MGQLRMTRHIRATPGAVFRAFTDPDIVADWMEASGIVDQHGALDVVGSTYTLIIWGPWRFRSEVMRCEPPGAYQLVSKGPLGAWARQTASLTAVDDATELVLDTDWGVLGPIGRWLERRFVRSGSDPAASRELDRLVQIVSGDPAGIREPLVPGGRKARQVAVARLRASGQTSPGPHPS